MINRGTERKPMNASSLHRFARQTALWLNALLLASFVSNLGGSHLAGAEPVVESTLNVLFIAVDDLRPELGCYGNTQIKSPNIDRLARRGMVFERAYCHEAHCFPTRTSLLTGRRPDWIRSHGGRARFQQELAKIVSLPKQFKNHGYHTQAFGKIYHSCFATAYVGDRLNDPTSWSVPAWYPGPRYYYTPEGVTAARQVFQQMTGKTGEALDDWEKHFVLGPPTETPEVAEDVLYDGQVAARAVEALRGAGERPFFLAVGFLKPHLPFVAPKKYWDLYEPGAITVADNPLPPKNAPPCAFQDSLHLRRYHGVPDKGPISEERRRRLIHGYYACVSFVDAQIGRVLDELDRLRLDEHTIVILWGDHGWHLGEHGMWGKATNFERSVRAPLILSVPGMETAGEKTDALVEFVDIYPTLCELAGLPVPEGLEGTSFTPLLQDPDRRWKSATFSQYRRRGVVGRSMRTDRYRLTCWFPLNKSEKVAIELYDYKTDPAETENLANRPEHAELVHQLTDKLKAGWQAAKPP